MVLLVIMVLLVMMMAIVMAMMVIVLFAEHPPVLVRYSHRHKYTHC